MALLSPLPSAIRVLPSKSMAETPVFVPASTSGEDICRRKSSVVAVDAPQFVTILLACEAAGSAGVMVRVRDEVLIAVIVRDTPSLSYSMCWLTENRAATGMMTVVVVQAAVV